MSFTIPEFVPPLIVGWCENLFKKGQKQHITDNYYNNLIGLRNFLDTVLAEFEKNRVADAAFRKR